jgi:hypothetical protein
MKTIKITVEITFSEEIINNKDIKEVVTNVHEGLIKTLNDSWLAPCDEETITEQIVTIEPITNTKLTYDVFN